MVYREDKHEEQTANRKIEVSEFSKSVELNINEGEKINGKSWVE